MIVTVMIATTTSMTCLSTSAPTTQLATSLNSSRLTWLLHCNDRDDFDDCRDDLDDCHGDFDNQNELDDKFHPVVLVVQEEHCPL